MSVDQQPPGGEYPPRPGAGDGASPAGYPPQAPAGYGPQPPTGYGPQAPTGYGPPPSAGYGPPPSAGYGPPVAGDGSQPPTGYGPPPAGYGTAVPPPARDRRPHKRVLLTVGLVLGLVFIVQAGIMLVDLSMSRTETTHHTYDPVSVVELIADGAVNVTAGEGDVEVDAVARSGLRSPRYSAEERGERLVVTHRCGFWAFGTWRCSGELDVTLPADTEVIVRTSNGAVVASGLAGDVDLRTSNGRIEAVGIGGRLTAHTSNGAIAVRDAGDDVELRTSNGRIEASQVDGSVDADTSNGRIEVRDVGGDARATTSNGRIDVEQVEGDVVARTSNGRVTVTGTGEPVRLTISTTNGDEIVEGATDPDATRTVEIRSTNGDVAFLAP